MFLTTKTLLYPFRVKISLTVLCGRLFSESLASVYLVRSGSLLWRFLNLLNPFAVILVLDLDASDILLLLVSLRVSVTCSGGHFGSGDRR